MSKEMRKVEILERGQWKPCEFLDISKGDTFRMFEPDGKPVKDKIGKTDFLAVSDIYRRDKDDVWNLSFLFYYNSFWNPAWGGSLRFYDSPQQGLDGRDEHIENHQLAEVEFKPNRLLMFDGRIPHGADAPKERARYMDRRSLVLRGDEVKLTHV